MAYSQFPTDGDPILRRTIHTFNLDISETKIEFLKERASALQSLTKRLKRQGFRVSFDFEQNSVDVEAERDKDTSDVVKLIDNSIFELELPNLNIQAIDEVHSNIANFDGHEVLVKRDRERRNIKVVSLNIETVQSCVQSIKGNGFLKNQTELQCGADIRNEDPNEGPCSFEKMDGEEDIIYDRIDEQSQSESPFEQRFGQQDSPRSSLLFSSTFTCELTGSGADVWRKVDQVANQYQCRIDTKNYPPRKTTQRARIQVVFDEIQKVKCDGIVNSCNPQLTLGVGSGLSKKILKEGGEGLQRSLCENYPEGIEYGEVARSPSGAITSCKLIYHGALPIMPTDSTHPKYGEISRDCYKALCSVLTNTLLLATEDKLKSVAFPALGTGNLGYQTDLVIQLMFHVVRAFFESSTSTIETVYFVIYTQRPRVKQLFLFETLSDHLRTTVVERREDAFEALKDQTPVCEARFEVGHALLQVTNGAFLPVCDVTDSLVVPWRKATLDNKTSNVIVDCFESSIQEDIYKQYATQLGPECKVAKDTSTLPGRTVYHLYCKNDEDSVSVRALERGLKQLDKQDLTSMAIPVVSDGSRLSQPHDAAKNIVKAIGSLKSKYRIVRVIVQNSNHYQTFISQLLDRTKLHRGPFTDVAFDNIIPVSPSPVTLGSVHFRVTSGSEERNMEAARDLKHQLGVQIMYMVSARTRT